MTEEYKNTKRFYKDQLWQSKQNAIGKHKIEKLLSVFNISLEARKIAKSMSPKIVSQSYQGDMFAMGMGEKDSIIPAFTVQLGKSGIIWCSCGAMDNLELDICGHVLFALKYSSNYWIGVSQTIENYIQNSFSKVDKR
jgi:hypothetical protein